MTRSGRPRLIKRILSLTNWITAKTHPYRDGAISSGAAIDVWHAPSSIDTVAISEVCYCGLSASTFHNIARPVLRDWP
jgi:hypothetical protein